VDRFQDLVDDLHYFMEHVSRNGRTAQPYVMGHSFGGQVVINFLAQHPKEVPGAVLSSPNIKLVTDVPWLKRTLGKMASRAVPYLRVPNEVNPEMISHDIEIVRKYRGDKLVQNKITLRLGAELLDNLDNIMELAPKIKTPCLIFHGGGDRITSPEASENFFKKMKVRDREMKIYPGFYHETLNEIGKERVYQDVATWLSGRI
jgi:alpha-beta hydrolase superfamily lysophospholipase